MELTSPSNRPVNGTALSPQYYSNSEPRAGVTLDATEQPISFLVSSKRDGQNGLHPTLLLVTSVTTILKDMSSISCLCFALGITNVPVRVNVSTHVLPFILNLILRVNGHLDLVHYDKLDGSHG